MAVTVGDFSREKYKEITKCTYSRFTEPKFVKGLYLLIKNIIVTGAFLTYRSLEIRKPEY